MMDLAITVLVILGFVALGIWLFEDDDHDEWRGY